LWVRQRAYLRVEHLSYPQNIRLGGKVLPGTNVLAYLAGASETKKKVL